MSPHVYCTLSAKSNVVVCMRCPMPHGEGVAIALLEKTRFSPVVLRLTCRILCLVYLILLVAVLVGLEWWGERSWFLSLALFAPPLLLLVPMGLFLPVCALLRQWRLVGLQLLCAAGLLSVFMTFRWTADPGPQPGTVTLVTHNVGDGSRSQFAEFLQKEKPDVILLQDSGLRAAEYIRKYSNYYSANCGEFLCLSKQPIQRYGFVAQPKWEQQHVAARFEIAIEGRTTAFYSVHLPTPRAQLRPFLRQPADAVKSAIKESPGREGSYVEWVNERIDLARALADEVAREKLPFIAAGDFNTPDHGYIYHTLASRMQDSFATAGRGWGLTFPGYTRVPVTYFSPWLRIDYVFAGKGWQAVYCEPERGKQSQHRAVMARLRPL